MLDFVSTRDIHPGEEIFIDYGKKWAEAWDTHVRNFVSPCFDHDSGPCFRSSKLVKSMNDDKFNETYHDWSDDHFTACLSSNMPPTDDSIIFLIPYNIEEPLEKERNVDSDGKNEYVKSFRGVEYGHEGFDLAYMADDWVPCLILRADSEDEEFDVVYFTYETSAIVKEADVLRRMRALPSHSIKFLNKPFKSDSHWNGAFRHEIAIPNDIFPELWKDLLHETGNMETSGQTGT